MSKSDMQQYLIEILQSGYTSTIQGNIIQISNRWGTVGEKWKDCGSYWECTLETDYF